MFFQLKELHNISYEYAAATIPPAPLAPSPAPLGTSADAVERNGPFKECTRMLKKYHVRVDIDWGSLPLQLQRFISCIALSGSVFYCVQLHNFALVLS